MTAVALTTLLFILCGLRPGRDHSDARTPRQLYTSVRAAGWAAAWPAARTLIVVVLLLLVEACRLTWHAASAAGFVAGALAVHVARLGVHSLEGSQA